MSAARPKQPTDYLIAAKEKTMPRRLLRLSLALAALALAFSAGASGAQATPALKVSTITPDHVTPGGQMGMFIAYQNVGDEPLSAPLTIRITFPDGVEPATNWQQDQGPLPEPCLTAGQQIECSIEITGLEPGTQFDARVFPTVEVDASGPLPGGEIEVFGGGAPEAFSEPLSTIAAPPGPFAIEAFDVGMSAETAALPPEQAGSSPAALTTLFKPRSEAVNFFGLIEAVPTEQFRTVIAHVPPGLIGNPTATPLRCTQAQLVSPNGNLNVPNCPPESQVGLAQLNFNNIVPLYNLVPPPGAPAAFGFFYNSTVTTLLPRIRPSDHGIDIVTEKANSSVPLPRIEVTLWGAPTEESHDRLRGICLAGSNTGYNGTPIGDCAPGSRSDLPFLRTPTSCPGTALPWGIEMDTYQHVGSFVHKEDTTPAMQSCEELPFDPSFSLSPTEKSARAASGLDAELTLPQSAGAGALAEADLKEAKVTLPQGVSVNPASADGLGACSDSELRLGLEGPSNCPESSKLGSLEVISPLLEEPIGGSVYLRSQASKDPASGELYRLAVELRNDERGIDIKLPGSLVADPSTGQLTATFKELPQLPFESLQLHFKQGARAPLSLPQSCGTYSTHAELNSWSGKSVSIDPAFTVDESCSAPPFSPGFEAGVTDNAAGSYSPLLFRVTRDSGEPNISRISTTLPEGELAKFAGVTLCPPVGMQSGNCPAASQIGSVQAAIGDTTNPLFLPQQGKQPINAYIGGPYNGAPYSVLVAVPAQAGPFDLGTVLVRSKVTVDPETTQASVISEPLPQIYGGIPVTYRDVRVNIDRPEYAINPTDCEPTSFSGTISSAQGQEAQVADRFQVADCARLGFKPKLSLTLKGEVSRSSHPRLIANLKARAGDANIARAQVKLPPSAFLDQSHIGTVCTRVQFAADQCPKRSIYGHASATSPLLGYPLKGNVYLRSSSHKLPDLVVDLNGPYSAPIEVALAGKTDSVKGALRNTFEAVPDAPVAKFHLELFGGSKGLIEMSSGFCAHPEAQMRFTAQNGKELSQSPAVKAADCGSKHGAKRKGR